MLRHVGAMAAALVAGEGEPGEFHLAVRVGSPLERANPHNVPVGGLGEVAGPGQGVVLGKGGLDRVHHDLGHGVVIRAVEFQFRGDGEEGE